MKAFLLILVSVFLTILPFFHLGLFDVHDPTSAYRLYTLFETLKDGQFPAMWSNLLNFGYGYPLHLYYAPLFGYLGTLILPLVTSYEVAVKVALAVASLVGSFGMYKLLSSAGFYPALLGSVAFTYLPYRASALYVRGSYSEFLAMSILPWVIYAWKRPQNNKKVIVTTAMITALFALSHNTLLLLSVPIIIAQLILFQRPYVKGSLYALALTFGLTAWFILPVFFERGFVQVESIAGLTKYSDHFLSLAQLWYSRWGYGGSGIGVEGDNMSFMIGKGQLILALFGALALAYKKAWKHLSLYGFITVMAIFIALPISVAIWDALPLLSIMQFPWRSLAVAGVGVSGLSAYALHYLPKRFLPYLAFLLCGLIMYTNLIYFNPWEYREFNKDILSSPSNLDPLVRDKIPEYLPRWMPSPLERSSDSLSRTATTVYGTLELHNTEPLIISTAYMPHWQLRLDGALTPIAPTTAGLITTVDPVQSGQVKVELTWHPTNLEIVAQVISALTIAAVIGLLLL